MLNGLNDLGENESEGFFTPVSTQKNRFPT